MRHKAKTVCKFLVSLELPTGSNSSAMQQYIRSAITSYKGGFNPDDPLFNFSSEGLTVAMVEKTTFYVKGR